MIPLPRLVLEVLGYEPDESTYASVPDLNAVPDEVIRDAQRLVPHGRLYASAFLKHFLPREPLGLVSEFIEDVVVGGEPAPTWGRRDVVCFLLSPGFPALLTLTSDGFAARLRAVPGAEPSWVCTPDGAPGVVVRPITYRWSCPAGLSTWVIQEGDTPRPIADVALAYRRWLAREFWRWWFGRLAKSTPPNQDELGPLSADMRVALGGLRRELDELPAATEAPGYRGPDDWYTRSTSTMEPWRKALRNVIAHPDDDEPRLAYGAALRPQDPDLARFIELQVEAGRERRRKREGRFGIFPSEDRKLLEKHGARWARTMAKYSSRQEFDRGFIFEIGIEPNLFLEYGDWLLKNAPIRLVYFGVSEVGPFPYRELFASPLLERIDAIALINREVTDEDVEVIAASPHLGRLLCLDLTDNRLTERAFKALAAAPATRKLLAVGRRQGSQGSYFPGPVYAATGEDDGYERPIWDWTPMTEQGRALEREYGYIPWLHPQDNGCDWLDARYYLDQGLLPVKPPGAPVDA